jgi:hypothetical protein
MGRTNPRHRPPPVGSATFDAHAITRPPRPEQPCWQCHWYGYMVDGNAAYCVNPVGLAIRPDALHGCCSYELDPVMDVGEQVPQPPPTSSRAALALRMHAERERLVELKLKIGFAKAPWQKRHRIVSRHGELSEREE